MAERRFLNRSRRAALSTWSLNISVIVCSSGLVGDVFTELARELKIAVMVAGLMLMVVGVLVAPDDEGGR